MADEATPGPWRNDGGDIWEYIEGQCGQFTGLETNKNCRTKQSNRNATFIATSRTAAPLAWKALLGTIEALELCHIRHDGDDPAVFDALQSIREQFKEVVL